MTGRRHARELALKSLYALETSGRDIEEILLQLGDEEEVRDDLRQFAGRIVGAVLKNNDFLNKEIARLAQNWEIDRIAIIDLIILRMALAEIHYLPDVPEKVAINEAIDLAKEYSTNESSSFVNGILDAALERSIDDVG